MTEFTDRLTNEQTPFAKQDRKTRMRNLRGSCMLLLVIAGIYGGFMLKGYIWPDPAKATLATVARTDCQELLFEIANQNGRSNVGEAAVEKIHDQDLLATLALQENGSVCFHAAQKLSQPALLEKVALESDSESASRSAILRVTNQDLLERIALNRPSMVAMSAALRLQDPAAARRVFEKSSDWRARLAAARASEDPELLKTIASDADSYSVLYEAIRSLKKYPTAVIDLLLDEKFKRTEDFPYAALLNGGYPEQKLLRLIAQTETLDTNVRRKAIRRLTDQEFLASLACSVSDETIRSAVFKQLTNQDTLVGLAKSNAYANVRRDAIRGLTDISLLQELVQDPSEDIQQAATQRLERLVPTDDPLFIEQFRKGLESTDDQLAVIALASNRGPKATDRIESQASIRRVALHNNQYSRICAIKRLRDQAALRKIATNSNEPWPVRAAAMRCISNQQWLMAMFARPAAKTNPFVHASDPQKLDMLRCITDQKLLAKIATDAKSIAKVNDSLMRMVTRRITDPALSQKVALESPYWYAPYLYAKRGTDPDTLAKIGRKYPNDREIAEHISPKLTDRKLLQAIINSSILHHKWSRAEIRLAELDRMAAKNKDAP
jgi:hypothetical protein